MSHQALAGYPMHLTEGAPFDRQPPRTLSSLFRQRPLQRFAAGSAIFWEGDPAKHIFEVVEGTLRAFRIVGDGRRVKAHAKGRLSTLWSVPPSSSDPPITQR